MKGRGRDAALLAVPESGLPGREAVLGRVTADGGLVLDAGVRRFAVYLDTRRAAVWCPACGSAREFRGA